MPCSGQPAAISFGCVESAPTVAFLHGTYEPAAVPDQAPGFRCETAAA